MASVSEVHRVELDALWNAGDAAAFLQVHPGTVRKMVNSGQLKALEIAGEMRFRPHELEAWADQRDWYGTRRSA